MKKSVLLSSGMVASAVLLTGGAAANSGRHDGWPPALPSIVGTWRVQVTVRVDAEDCTNAAPVPGGPNPFPSLNTFHVGGTMSETGSRSPPSLRSPGHSVWQPSGKGTYDARFTFQGFDTNGFLATNMDIRSAITVSADGNTFNGVSRFQFGFVDGVTLPFCATLEGVRFSL